MSPSDFDRLVQESMDVIAPRFRRRLHNVVFAVEPEPRRPGLLGKYEGVPLTQRTTAASFYPPDRITIYQGPHERLARSGEELRRLVQETVWHEVAHYFGMEEGQVLRAERRRARLALRRRLR
jgi:predicted Zn-dependent protease with MMP-like domain